MPGQWLACLACVLAALAGCAQPGVQGPGGERTSTGTSADAGGGSSTAPEAAWSGDDIILSGLIDPYRGGFLANLSARNTGSHTFGYAVPDCVTGPWHARLSGPPGENLTYRDPDAMRAMCAGHMLGRLEPGAWLNWTARECTLHAACDNHWDGVLWANGSASPAPPGAYTWRFIFSYFDTPAEADPDGGGFRSPQGRHGKELAFTVDLPAGS